MHVIGTAGHVDHGKSTLVKSLTGTDPDRLAEEKTRGLTIDLGFAHLSLPSGDSAGIVDVPGHERFIKNMLAGAGGISVCLFVIAANEGWRPQSLEHLAIIDLLGVAAGVIAITKKDLAEDTELQALIEETAARLAPTSLSGSPIVPCSARTGDGMHELLKEIDRVVALAPPAPDLGRPRLWVDRAFTIAGAGTVVTGTLAGGSFRRGDEVVVSPHGLDARVRALQTHNREVDEAVPGSRVAMNLTGLSRDSVRRGNAIVAPGRWRETRTVDARIEVVSEALAGRAHRLTEKGAHLLYTGSAETPVRIKLLGSKALEAGTSGYARLRLRDELPLAPGDRFVLRDAGRVLTFGGGTVLDPGPPTRPIDDGRVKLLEHLENASPRVAAIALVEYEGRVPVRDLRARVGTSALPDEVVVFGSVALSATRAQALKERLAEIVAGHHRDHPLERGVATESVRANLDLDAATFGALVDATSSVIKDAALLRLSDHQVSLGDTESAERADLLKRLDGSAFAPPMAEELQIDRALLKALVDAGDLVPIKGFYLTKARADEAKALVRQAIEERGPVTVAQIRDLLGTTRKYAVPLCEWLDATGTTLRRGDVRLLGPRS